MNDNFLFSCVPLTPDPDNHILMRTAKDLYLKYGKQLEALRCAIMLNDLDVIQEIFLGCSDKLVFFKALRLKHSR